MMINIYQQMLIYKQLKKLFNNTKFELNTCIYIIIKIVMKKLFTTKDNYIELKS